MKFSFAPIEGVCIIDPDRLEDDRGFFARVFCREEFKNHGLNPNLVQCSISFNKKKGTLRGMHYQIKPYEEAKLVRCTQGCIYDVVIDLRPDSQTYTQWFAVELNAENRKMIYIPEGMAHGFQTLEDNTEVFYQMSKEYHAESARGVLWNDEVFDIQWRIENPILLEKDKNYSAFIKGEN